MMTKEKAVAFADAWFAAWNSHDVDRIMSLYADSIEHTSPFIVRYTPEGQTPPRSLKGKEAVHAYFARAIRLNPTLQFIPMHTAVGMETVTLIYRRMNGDLAAELFAFDDSGRVVRSISHYA